MAAVFGLGVVHEPSGGEGRPVKDVHERQPALVAHCRQCLCNSVLFSPNPCFFMYKYLV